MGRREPGHYGCGTLLLLGVVAYVGWSLYTREPRPDQPGPAPAAPARPARRFPAVGAVAVLLTQGRRGTFLAVDDGGWDEMGDAEDAQDPNYMLELMKVGKVFYVVNGTRGRVIKSGFISMRLRILEGDAAGLEGWTRAENVHFPP
jgi:hypothetical protein